MKSVNLAFINSKICLFTFWSSDYQFIPLVSFKPDFGCLRKTPASWPEFYGGSRSLVWTRLFIPEIKDYRRFAPIPIHPMLVRPHFLLPQTLSAPNTYLFAPCKFQFAPCPESSVRPSFHFASSFSSPQFLMQLHITFHPQKLQIHFVYVNISTNYSTEFWYAPPPPAFRIDSLLQRVAFSLKAITKFTNFLQRYNKN